MQVKRPNKINKDHLKSLQDPDMYIYIYIYTYIDR